MPISAQRQLVLVADDEPAIIELVTRAIMNIGLVALPVENGAAALQAVEQHHHHLHCVLMDIVMPILDGIDAALAIQQSRPELPLILMSGMFSDAHAASIQQLRLVGLLEKPFSLTELRRVILQAKPEPDVDGLDGAELS